MRPIPSCPDYFASEDGRIWRDGRPLTCGTNGRGYLKVTISIRGRRQDKYAHRLICEAFHGPCPPDHECRHLDGRRDHNVPSNLCWSTKAENEADKLRHGTLNCGERNGQATLNKETVLEGRRRAAAGEQVKSIATDLGVNYRALLDAVMGRKWKSLPGAIPAYSTRRRFTGSQVEEIRALYGKKPICELIAMFGVSDSALYKIASGRVYAHVDKTWNARKRGAK